MPLFWKTARGRSDRPTLSRSRPSLEELETRIVPYATTGNLWPHPELVTLSFVPDGTLMTSGTGGNVYSNLFATLDARFSTEEWQAEVIKAAQMWAQYANVNFDIVGDNGTTSGQGSYQQGDAGMGDIRVGGYAMSSAYLGVAYLPPPVNNYSIAGDIGFNTTKTWNVGSTYDLQTVAMHEVGHALGLSHTSVNGAVQYGSYNGMKWELDADDIAGIQAIYGARQNDVFDAVLSNDSFTTASVLTTYINPLTKTAHFNNLDVTNTQDEDYFKVITPLGSTHLTVRVQTDGLSLLRPEVNIYDSAHNEVAWEAVYDTYDGSTVTLNIEGVSALQTYYIRVRGADLTPFGTGRYALSIGLGSAELPSVTPPNTQTANGSTLQGGGGNMLEALLSGTSKWVSSFTSYLNWLSSSSGMSYSSWTSWLSKTTTATKDYYAVDEAAHEASHAETGMTCTTPGHTHQGSSDPGCGCATCAAAFPALVSAGQNNGVESDNVLASTFSRDTSTARQDATGSGRRDVASGDSGRQDSEVRGERTGKEEDRDRSHSQRLVDSSSGGGDVAAATDAFFADLGKKGRSLWGRLPGF
jgi:hypothetical protein